MSVDAAVHKTQLKSACNKSVTLKLMLAQHPATEYFEIECKMYFIRRRCVISVISTLCSQYQYFLTEEFKKHSAVNFDIFSVRFCCFSR